MWAVAHEQIAVKPIFRTRGRPDATSEQANKNETQRTKKLFVKQSQNTKGLQIGHS